MIDGHSCTKLADNIGRQGMDENRDTYTVADLSRIFGVSRRTVWNYIQKWEPRRVRIRGEGPGRPRTAFVIPDLDLWVGEVIRRSVRDPRIEATFDEPLPEKNIWGNRLARRLHDGFSMMAWSG